MAEPKGPIVLICGVNPDGTLRTVELDADDFLRVTLAAQAANIDVNIAAQGVQLTVKQPTAGDLKVGDHGWIGAAWQKQPLNIGVSAPLFRRFSTGTLPAGNSFLSDTAVPAGEIWQITTFAFQYYGTNPTHVDYIVYGDGADIYLHTQQTVVSDKFYALPGQVTLGAGDYLKLRVVGATLNDDLTATACGRRIDIDQ